MQPFLWQPPIELSRTEQTSMKRIKRAKLFVYLRDLDTGPGTGCWDHACQCGRSHGH
jgi:hypothetical protein